MAFTLTLDGKPHRIDIVRRRPHLVLRIDGREHLVAGVDTSADGHAVVEIDGEAVPFVRARSASRQFLRLGGRNFEARLFDPVAAEAEAGGGQDAIRAPMPGAVVTVHKAAGESVARGEKIVTIESMKLQTALLAPRDGVIAAVRRAEGEVFEKDEVIVMLEEAAQEG